MRWYCTELAEYGAFQGTASTLEKRHFIFDFQDEHFFEVNPKSGNYLSRPKLEATSVYTGCLPWTNGPAVH